MLLGVNFQGINAVWGFTGCCCLISQTRPKGFSLLVLPFHIFLTTPCSFSVTQQKTSRYEQRNQWVTTHQYRKHRGRSGITGGCCATSFRHRAQILKVTWAYKVASTLRNSPFLEGPVQSLNTYFLHLLQNFFLKCKKTAD